MMPWRLGWPPWEPQRVQDDRRRALEDLERATVDLTETRQQVRRTERVTDGLRTAKARNHFSESMEALFRSHGRGHHDPQQQGG